MLKIRLARIGKKKRPTYRLIVSESTKDTYGHYLERLGSYDPINKVTEVNKERILFWIKNGAQLSPTVHNLLVSQNVIDGKKVKAFTPKKKEQTEEEKAAAAKSAQSPAAAATPEAPEPEEKPTEEKPAQEAKVEKPEAEKPVEDQTKQAPEGDKAEEKKE